MSQMLKSSGAMSIATMTSRVLGLVREIAYTSFMGTSWVADAFNLAFMVPNLFRRLLGEGALTAAFIPIFKEKEKLQGEREMWQAANAVISGLSAAATLFILVGIALISTMLSLRGGLGEAVKWATILERYFPYVLLGSLGAAGFVAFGGRSGWPGRRYVVALGLATTALGLLGFLALWGATLPALTGGRTLLMLGLLRIMLPYLLLVCVAAIFMGMLNSRGHFFVPAMGATTLNLAMIASVWWLAPRMGHLLEEQIYGLAVGVVVAGLAQAGFQFPLLYREGFRFRWVTPWHDPTVRRVVTQMIPGAIGVAAFQINVLLTQSMAFWVGAGVVSSFTVAVRLMELPQGVFGLSLATYLLPTLSGLAAEKKYPEFRTTLAQAVGWLVFVNLLAAALLFSLAEPMMRLLFERGRFDEVSTANSALALRCLAPGLVAFSLVNILARAFYALGDTKTPMRISVFALGVNVLLSAALVWRLKQGGLGTANTLSALMNMSLLFYALKKKLKVLDLGRLPRDLGVLSGAAVLAGLAAWVAAWQWGLHYGHRSLWTRAGEVFVPMGLAALTYFGVAEFGGAGHLQELTGMVRKRLGR